MSAKTKPTPATTVGPARGTANNPFGGFASSDPRDADQRLVKAFDVAKAQFETATTKVRISFTHRSHLVQSALFKQGRQDLAAVNYARGLAKMPPITEAENARRVTNANAGSSKHNSYPSLAIDVAITINGVYIGNDVTPYRQFAALMGRANAAIKWGGLFPGFIDAGHFEI